MVVEQKIASNWHSNWSPGLILGAFYTIFVEPDPFKGVLGPSLAGQRPETKTKMQNPLKNPTQHLISNTRNRRGCFTPAAQSAKAVARQPDRSTGTGHNENCGAAAGGQRTLVLGLILGN